MPAACCRTCTGARVRRPAARGCPTGPPPPLPPRCLLFPAAARHLACIACWLATRAPLWAFTLARPALPLLLRACRPVWLLPHLLAGCYVRVPGESAAPSCCTMRCTGPRTPCPASRPVASVQRRQAAMAGSDGLRCPRQQHWQSHPPCNHCTCMPASKPSKCPACLPSTTRPADLPGGAARAARAGGGHRSRQV